MNPTDREGNTRRRNLGNWGERYAADYLFDRGYSIIERNARTPYGEIDLVARQEVKTHPLSQSSAGLSSFVTVFVEVKTRSSAAFGLPEESITNRKKEHLLDSSQAYLQAHPELDGDWRVDVIAIQRSNKSTEPNITHFENAITWLKSNP